MNPNTNEFEPLHEMNQQERNRSKEEQRRIEQNLEKRLRDHLNACTRLDKTTLLHPDGTPVPEHWGVYTVGELVEVKNHTFRIAYIGKSVLVLEPVGPVIDPTDG